MIQSGRSLELDFLRSFQIVVSKDVKSLQLMLTIFKALGMAAPNLTKTTFDPFVIAIIRKERGGIKLK
jgi:hypothetical protein